jgi:endonuclease YncB( thermonuclease family)
VTLFNPTVASIVGFHDGDTMYLDVRFVVLDQAWIMEGIPDNLPKVRYRFARINAPEIATPEGKASLAALMARVGPLPAPCFIGSTIASHFVRDNYGRILVETQLPDGTNLSDWMLTNGWASPYPKMTMEPDELRDTIRRMSNALALELPAAVHADVATKLVQVDEALVRLALYEAGY